jgi:hypothetical protein
MNACVVYILRGGVWHYRRRIPVDLRHFFPERSEIKLSLKSSSRVKSAILANRMAVKLDETFTTMRLGMEAMTCDQMTQNVQELLDRTLRETEDARAQGEPVPGAERLCEMHALVSAELSAPSDGGGAQLGGYDTPKR